MFIREVKKQRSKDTRIFYQYNLVQASRIEGKVKQQVILYLGSDEQLRDKNNQKMVLEYLKSRIFGQPGLFTEQLSAELKKLAEGYYQKYLIKYGEELADKVSIPPHPDTADYHRVDLEGLEIEDSKSFGPEHLCKQILEQLDLKSCLHSAGLNLEQTHQSLAAIAARAIYCASEYKTAQILKMNSELLACYHIDEPLSHKQLYTISDRLYEHKERIDRFLDKRTADMFGIKDKIVIFDISNTYFESGKRGSKLATYGRSKEKRGDCPLVVFTGVINSYGFIRHSRIYEGNKTDSQTLEDMIADLEKYSEKDKNKTVVMDAGIATEDNLKMLRSKGYDYVCVSRKRLKDYPLDEDKKIFRKTDRGKQQVELTVFHPNDYPDTWMYVQSEMKRRKESSMSGKLIERFEQELDSIRGALCKKGGTKRIEKVWERIGRIREKYKGVSGRYEIKIKEQKGQAIDMNWELKPDIIREDKENGVYFIRTSYEDADEAVLWDIYNTIREVESTFRCLKKDLNIRPVHHQKDERIESHLYLTLLAYQLVNTIRRKLKSYGIHYDWTNLVRIMSTQTIQTIQVPTEKKNIYIRRPSKPIAEVKQIYDATGCKNTQKPIKKYVVYH